LNSLNINDNKKKLFIYFYSFGRKIKKDKVQNFIDIMIYYYEYDTQKLYLIYLNIYFKIDSKVITLKQHPPNTRYKAIMRSFNTAILKFIISYIFLNN